MDRQTILRAIHDPGAVVGNRLGPSWGEGNNGYSDEQESLWEWIARAVMHELQPALTAVEQELDEARDRAEAASNLHANAEFELARARAAGFAEAVAMLRDDDRYTNWWTALPEQDPAYGYWQQPARRHLADYLETVGLSTSEHSV